MGSELRPEGDVRYEAAYGGPAVASGRMDVKVFAPALISMAQLVEHSAEVVFKRGSVVSVQISANFKRSSFVYELIASPVMLAGLQILAGLSISDIDRLLRWIGLVGDGKDSLFAFLRAFGGKKIEGKPDGHGNIIITVTGDDATINAGVIPPQVWDLLRSQLVRRDVEGVIAPLEQPGIQEFRAGAEREKPRLIATKADVPQMRAEKVEVDATPIEEGVARTVVELVSPSFREGYSWKVAQGGDPFFVHILDEAYIASIEGGRSFEKGDFMIVDLRTRSWEENNKLHFEHDIVKVHEHRHHGAKQIPLLPPPSDE